MDLRLHNLPYHHHHRHPRVDSHDCRLISRTNAILPPQQGTPSSFKYFYPPTVPAATMPTKAPVTSLSSTGNSAGSATKKRGAGVASKSRVIRDGGDLRNRRQEKESHHVRKDFEYVGRLDSSRTNTETELGHFSNMVNMSCQKGDYDDCLYFLRGMVSAGHFPGSPLCTKIIKGLSSCAASSDPSSTSALSKANQVMEILENHGSPDVFAYNALLTFICKESKAATSVMESGTALIDRMRAHACSPDITTYNILLGALCNKGRLDLAMKVLDQMLQENQCQPTLVTYTIFIDACIADMRDNNKGKGGGGITQLVNLLEEMVAMGLQPDNYTYNTVLKGLCKHGLVDQAWEFLRTLSSSKLTPGPEVFAYNILLRSLLDGNRWEDAQKLVSEMVATGQCRPNEVTYSILITSLCQQGMVDEAIQAIDEMMAIGLKPDTFCSDPIISTYCRQGRMDLAITFMERIQSCGYIPDIVNYNTILSSLCKSGAAYRALEVLDKLEEIGCRPSTSTYNAVVGGLWNCGHRTEAVNTLSQMVDKGIHPDEVTYNSLISCLCRDGLVDHAIQLMEDMEDTAGYLPTVITYNTIILGLCKVNRIHAAIEILMEMMERGSRPNDSTYIILVEGLAYAGHGEEAAEVAETLLSCKAISRDSIGRLKRTLQKSIAGRFRR